MGGVIAKAKKYGWLAINGANRLFAAAADHIPIIGPAASYPFQIAASNTTFDSDQLGQISKHALLALFTAPVNKKYFSVIEDKKFTLSPPNVSVAPISQHTGTATRSTMLMVSGHNPRLPQTKAIAHTVVHNKRVDSQHPRAGMAGYATVYFARQIALDGATDNFDVNIRGYTTYVDHNEDS